MSRGMAAANATASQAAHVRPIIFVEPRFASGTLYLHNAIGSYTWGSQTWLGIGAFGEMSAIEETDDLSAYRVWFRLNGLDSSVIAEATGQTIYQRLVIVYLGFIGDDGLLVATPDERWRGHMHTMEIHHGDALDSITLNCESELIRDRIPNGSRFTDEDQQARFASDTQFQFLPQMADAQVHWGPGGERVSLGPPAPRDGPGPGGVPRTPGRGPRTV